MLEVTIILLFAGLIVLTILYYPRLILLRRKRLKKRPFPVSWLAILEKNLSIYHFLSLEQQLRLKENIQIFLADKQFIGCQGLIIRLEMKLTIAGVACLLLFKEPSSYFSKVRTILLYPTAFVVSVTNNLGDYILEESRETRLGEAWLKDQVVLSWQQIQYDVQHWHDGHNVILHEFVHQLDFEDGQANGVPILGKNSSYLLWAEVMNQEYQNLCNNIRLGRQSAIDGYGSKNPAEFFAVVSETFFENPKELFSNHPELYQLLKNYYQLNPLLWKQF